MAVVKVTVLVEVDDVPVSPFPLVRRFTVNTAHPFNSKQPSSSSFINLPSTFLTTTQLAILESDQVVSVGFDGDTTKPITLNASGFLVIMDTTMTNGFISVRNLSGNPAFIRGIVGGS